MASPSPASEFYPRPPSLSATQYLYLPLLEGQVIRLVDLLPGVGNEPVSLRLLIAELGYHPEYEAISYVWGDASQNIPVLCNGRALNITVSLDAVFKRVRYSDRSRILWADAVCINQLHDGERSHHVAFMDEVYKQAKRVLVHFGDASDRDAAAVSSLVREHALLASKYKSVHDMPVVDGRDVILDDPRWQALSIFHRLPWFARKWVIQEAGLAREPICLYGKEEFSYRDLMRLAVWTTRCAAQLELRHDVAFATVHTDWIDWSPDWQQTSPDPSQTFLGLMNHSRWLSCSVKKDHIYALLGHPLARVEPGGQLMVQPAYSQSDEDVFVELATALIAQHGLRVLSPVDHTEDSFNSCSIPSWVPFYHDIELTACNFGVFPDFWYSASQGSNILQPPTVEAGFLQVGGVVFDTVRKATKLTKPVLNEDADLPEVEGLDVAVEHLQNQLKTIVSEALDAQNGQAYVSQQKVTEISLTLCAGLTRYRSAENDLDQHLRDFAGWYTRLGAPPLQDLQPGWSPPDVEIGDHERYLADVSMVCQGRTFLFTQGGRFGLGPVLARPGDLCCVLFGATVPFILRQAERKGHFKLVGEAYVQGIMRGEAFRSADNNEQPFIIC